MKVILQRVDDAFHFEAKGQSEVVNHMDAGENIGGKNQGARPMEMLLMGLGGCSAIDVVLILGKQKQVIDDLRIEVSGERVEIEGTEMKPFRTIHLEFIFKGNLDEKRVARAISLSMEKYCSATAQFSCSANITSSYRIEN